MPEQARQCRARKAAPIGGLPRDEALTARRTPIVPDHFRRDCGLVDKDEAWCTQLGLLSFQRSALGSNIRPILLGGVQCFF
jgi:hypothetical protein